MPAETALPATWPPPYPRHRPVDVATAQDLDRRAAQEHGLAGLLLMEHASRGVAAVAARMAPEGLVAVLAGPGNNGGDGWGVARHLASWGRRVRLICCAAERPAGEGDAAREAAWAAAEAGVAVHHPGEDPAPVAGLLADAALLVDALFGVGLSRDLEPPYPALVEAMNAAAGRRLAVDVPSGLDADTGALRPVALRADVTATMAVPKRGLLEGHGPAHAGQVVEVDIGLPGALHHPFCLEPPGA